jgi:hypothetical protein
VDTTQSNGDGSERIREDFNRAEEVKPEPPRPLKRTVPPADPFPHEALGPELAPVAKAVQALTQASMAICANSTLAAANFATQAHVNIELPTGEIKPISEYIVTQADSGERKTAADERALLGVRLRSRTLAENYPGLLQLHVNKLEAYEKQRAQEMAAHKKSAKEDKLKALNDVGAEPLAPPKPLLIVSDITIEGIFRLLREGPGYCGLFSSEGGGFLGGHGMSNEAILRTAAGCSQLWDGVPLDKYEGSMGAMSSMAGAAACIYWSNRGWPIACSATPF